MGTTKEHMASIPLATFGRHRDSDGVLDPAGVMANEIGPNGLSKGTFTLLATAIGQIGEAVVITDTAATIQYVNPPFTRVTGYTVEEAVGQNTRFLKSDRQDPAYYQDLWKTIPSGRVWQGELINRRVNPRVLEHVTRGIGFEHCFD